MIISLDTLMANAEATKKPPRRIPHTPRPANSKILKRHNRAAWENWAGRHDHHVRLTCA